MIHRRVYEVPFLQEALFMKTLPPARGTPLKKLAEAIILQALEDLWNTRHDYASVAFFREETFRRYARVAGIDHNDMLSILGNAGRVPKQNPFAPETKTQG